MGEPEAELRRRFVAGEPAAFEELFREFSPEVFRWIVRILRDRAAAEDALVEEQPYAEIADALGVPIGTVKSRVFRATRALREQLARAGVRPR